MSLSLSGEVVAVQERMTKLSYTPGLQDSGDLEPATRTITATAKPGSADYSASLTLAAPSDSRLSIKRVGLRLEVTIDSFGGSPAATQLSYAVHVGGVERLTGNWTATGAQLAGVSLDVAAGQITLGSATSIAIYFWVDQGNATLSVVRVRLAVGVCGTTTATEVFRLSHSGFFMVTGWFLREGTGTPYLRLTVDVSTWSFAPCFYERSIGGALTDKVVLALAYQYMSGWMNNGVATDLAYVDEVNINLRRQE